MSKRSGAVSAETKEWILTAAREEFLRYGFQGSSLRRICSAAGVTTGALYFFFQGKDELFASVLSQVTEPLARLIEAHYSRERDASGQDRKAGESGDLEAVESLIDFYFQNRQVWDILLHHLSHPTVRAFLDHLAETSTDHYQYLLERRMGGAPDRFDIHQFVHMQMDTLLTLISHDFDRQEMTAHSRSTVRMLRGAFQALLTP